MYYGARWYDPHIAHFVQADTIVPGAGNPMAHNRYAYVMYNPVKYTDPSGHLTDDQINAYLLIDMFGNLTEKDLMGYDSLAHYLSENMQGVYAFLSTIHIGDNIFGYSNQSGMVEYGAVTINDRGNLQFGETTFGEFLHDVSMPFAIREVAGNSYISYQGGDLSQQPGESPIANTFNITHNFTHRTTVTEEAIFSIAGAAAGGYLGGAIGASLSVSTVVAGKVGTSAEIIVDFGLNFGPIGVNENDWVSSYTYSGGPLTVPVTNINGATFGGYFTSSRAVISGCAWYQYSQPLSTDSVFP